MNLKSYCRGIGAGIIVTAIIMGVASNKRTITDEEAINRAKELGYTQSSVLTKPSSVEEQTDEKEVSVSDSSVSISKISVETPTSTSEAVVEPNKEDASVTTSSNESLVSISDSTSVSVIESEDGDDETELTDTSDSASSDDSDEAVEDPEGPTEEDDNLGDVSDGTSVLISIYKGDSSVTVSRRMYEAGLVESAVEFDKFLCENGYDKYLCVGEYEILTGLDFDTMAKIITRRKMN